MSCKFLVVLLLSCLCLCRMGKGNVGITSSDSTQTNAGIPSSYSAQRNAPTKKSMSSPSVINGRSTVPVDGQQTRFVAECELPTKLGEFRMRSYIHTSETQCLEPIVLINGDVAGKENVLVRIHDQCFTSEVLGSLRCDCKEQLEGSMRLIKEDEGVLIYLQQEGRGIGLSNKIGKSSQ